MLRLLLDIVVFVVFVLFGIEGFAYADSNSETKAVKYDKKKNMSIDLSIGYSQQVDSSNTKFKSLTFDLITTYSLNDYLDIFAGLPLVYTQRTDSQDTTRSNTGIGDIDFGLYYQLIKEDDFFISARPFLIVKTNSGSSPYRATGSEVVSGDGHWSIEGGADFSKTFDKITIFSQVAYTYFFDQIINSQRNEHGDVIYYHVGSSYQLNKNLSASLRVEDSFLGDSRINGVVSEDSRTPINITASAEYYLSPTVTITPLATFGLNNASKDFSFNITYGYKF